MSNIKLHFQLASVLDCTKIFIHYPQTFTVSGLMVVALRGRKEEGGWPHEADSRLERTLQRRMTQELGRQSSAPAAEGRPQLSFIRQSSSETGAPGWNGAKNLAWITQTLTAYRKGEKAALLALWDKRNKIIHKSTLFISSMEEWRKDLEEAIPQSRLN